MRLLKLGCISLDTGLLGNKALSVLKLLKPYKLKVMGQGFVWHGFWMCACIEWQAPLCDCTEQGGPSDALLLAVLKPYKLKGEAHSAHAEVWHTRCLAGVLEGRTCMT
jgi:hypothetical protein